MSAASCVDCKCRVECIADEIWHVLVEHSADRDDGPADVDHQRIYLLHRLEELAAYVHEHAVRP